MGSSTLPSGYLPVQSKDLVNRSGPNLCLIQQPPLIPGQVQIENEFPKLVILPCGYFFGHRHQQTENVTIDGNGPQTKTRLKQSLGLKIGRFLHVARQRPFCSEPFHTKINPYRTGPRDVVASDVVLARRRIYMEPTST